MKTNNLKRLQSVSNVCQQVESCTWEFGILLRSQQIGNCWIFSPMRVQFLVECRNPVYVIVRLMIPNLVESSLMGKIQDQSVSTYVLDSLWSVCQYLCTWRSVCTHTSNWHLVSCAFSNNCKNILPDIMAYVRCLSSGRMSTWTTWK